VVLSFLLQRKYTTHRKCLKLVEAKETDNLLLSAECRRYIVEPRYPTKALFRCENVCGN
jgi:hypothetical protein